ncbi:beta-amyrin 24-hydroxylase [Senna tora]|uniref:Beta-amyrin 24-hydroxylase n=1 Tax=Senna tora TaxID=362788 RepID=A0A834X1T7_9FABA|nr:beta-amyrin 24-hydroxylase [Senna tora]
MLEFQGNMVLIFFVWLVSISLIKTLFTKKTQSPLKLPPGPPLALPIIGHFHLLSSLVHQAFFNLSTKYGPLFHLMLGSKHCIVASSPEMAKEILRTNEESCSNHPPLIVGGCLTNGVLDYVFMPYGPHWRFMKKICMNELLSERTLEKFVSIRQQEIEAFLRSILQQNRSEQPLRVREELIKLTNNIISRMTMGKKCEGTNDEVGEITKAVQEVGVLLGTFNLCDYVVFLRNLDVQAVSKKLDTMMEKVMREREEARKMKNMMGDDQNCERGMDFLDCLIDLIGTEDSEMKFTRESAKVLTLEMFVAGTNSLAAAMEWTLAELIKNPKIFSKARKEIDSIVGKNRLVRESDIPNLPYIQAIAKETMRLHPPAPIIPRETTRMCKIGGYDVPSNSTLIVNYWAIGRDPNYWENPLEYSPERFLPKNGNDNLDVRGQHYQLLPFGSGRRGCPGASLTMLVFQTAMIDILLCEKDVDIPANLRRVISMF